jgi:hypothetical protein
MVGSRELGQGGFELGHSPEQIGAVVAEERAALEDLEDCGALLVAEQACAPREVEGGVPYRRPTVDGEAVGRLHGGERSSGLLGVPVATLAGRRCSVRDDLEGWIQAFQVATIAGPTRIARLRLQEVECQMRPDVWFAGLQ